MSNISDITVIKKLTYSYKNISCRIEFNMSEKKFKCTQLTKEGCPIIGNISGFYLDETDVYSNVRNNIDKRIPQIDFNKT